MSAVTQLTAIEYVRARDLISYVHAHSWKRLTDLRANGYEFYAAPRPDDAGRPIRIAIPTKEHAQNLQDAVSRVVDISAAIEGRDAASVVADMLSVTVDTIDVRIIPKHGGTRISLSSAPQIYGSLEQLIWASEAAETRMDHTAPGRKAHQGDIWLLPAKPSSFAFRIETVAPINSQQEMLDTTPTQPPLIHRAMWRLVRGLRQGEMAVQYDSWDHIEPLLTPSMCEALVELHSAVGGNEIEFSHNLSRKYHAPESAAYSGSTRYDTRVATQIYKLQSSLKRLPPAPGVVSASGTIVELKNKLPLRVRDKQLSMVEGPPRFDMDKSVVHVQVMECSDRRVRNLYLSLPEKEYREACKAHAAGLHVSATGTLVAITGKWALNPLESFVVLRRRPPKKKAEL